jgi:hypothetical protein
VNKSSGFIDPRRAQLNYLLIAMSFFDGIPKAKFSKKEPVLHLYTGGKKIELLSRCWKGTIGKQGQLS